jgi:hypothetical protein
MFSNWETQNKADNKIVKENLSKGEYKKAEIPDWFKNKYHPYQTGYFRTEHYDNLGIYGENPRDKFFNRTQKLNKLYSDNFDIAQGTSKTTDLLPGYGGIYLKKFRLYFNKWSNYKRNCYKRSLF